LPDEIFSALEDGVEMVLIVQDENITYAFPSSSINI